MKHQSGDGRFMQLLLPPKQVFIHYTGWSRGSQESPESMQLDSVRNDFVEVLDYLHCTPVFPYNQLVNSILNIT